MHNTAEEKQSALARTDIPSSSLAPIFTIGVLFFIFGFVTWLNGPLITFVKLAFDLDDVNAFLVLMAFYLSYFFLALPSSAILRWSGMKRGMAIGFVVMAAGAAMFGHFTTMRWYPGALSGLFTIGAGLSLLQTASNPYMSIVGPIESAARRIAIMGICSKVAGFLAPFVFGAIVLRGLDDFDARVKVAGPQAREALLNGFSAQVYWPYMIMAGLLIVMAIWIVRSNLPDIAAAEVNPDHVQHSGDGARGRSIFTFPHLWFGVLALFLYVGVEVMAGDAIGIYGDSFGLPLSQTRFLTSATLFAMLVGYLLGVALTPRFISQQSYLALSGVLGVVLTLGAYGTAGYASVGFIAALGFANAMMWPAIFPLAIRGLGRHTETGAALLIMAIAGGALMPWGFALLKQAVDFQFAYLALALPSYLFIAWYGLVGYRAGR
jgi:FHS family L-fucose permease-like MFS transporter